MLNSHLKTLNFIISFDLYKIDEVFIIICIL